MNALDIKLGFSGYQLLSWRLKTVRDFHGRRFGMIYDP